MSLIKTESCIVSGAVLPTDQMIRFAVNPQGVIVPDLTQKLPVPGIWIKADRDTLEKAMRRNSFAVAARDNVTVPRDLITQVEMGISRLALETISLAKRSGQIFIGADGVEEAVRHSKAGVYIVASDAAENGREKIQRLANVHNATTIDFWERAELGRCVGMEEAVHIAIEKGGLSTRIIGLHTLLKSIAS